MKIFHFDEIITFINVSGSILYWENMYSNNCKHHPDYIYILDINAPPSNGIAAPVIQADAFEVRNTANPSGVVIVYDTYV